MEDHTDNPPVRSQAAITRQAIARLAGTSTRGEVSASKPSRRHKRTPEDFNDWLRAVYAPSTHRDPQMVELVRDLRAAAREGIRVGSLDDVRRTAHYWSRVPSYERCADLWGQFEPWRDQQAQRRKSDRADHVVLVNDYGLCRVSLDSGFLAQIVTASGQV
jgi:hypothetical protein